MSKEAIEKKVLELAQRREQVLVSANLELGRIEGQIQLLREQLGEETSGTADASPAAAAPDETT